MSKELATIRARLRALDEQWLEILVERQALALAAARAKAAAGLEIKDLAIEAATVERHRKRARELGVEEEMAVAITRLLIDASCRVQESYLRRETNGRAS